MPLHLILIRFVEARLLSRLKDIQMLSAFLLFVIYTVQFIMKEQPKAYL